MKTNLPYFYSSSVNETSNNFILELIKRKRNMQRKAHRVLCIVYYILL
jgi:hypothetical protein